MTEWWSIILLLTTSWTGALAGILIKKGSDSFRLKTILKNKYLISGVLLYGLGTIIYIIALRGGNLSILYPIISTTYVWIAVFSKKMLGEKMNKYKWLGIALILIGVSFIGIGK